MISLFVALYSLLCLCTAVKTSDIKELHVRTVKSGEDVTIACDLSLIRDKNKEMKLCPSPGPGNKITGSVTHQGSNDGIKTHDKSCDGQIHLFFLLSVLRVGVLALMMMIFPIVLIIFKLRSK
ncbi:hypothetical protein HF521_012457 [Silurus meridionalis]|uniref:Uncharacterized protein n=1 Tax=Silurus meridionalis TaxID=175797 RepID=A0A8T0AGR8_SILME|nr:hypothetical protein HF521_012457 [Silurus meridionalis]